LPCVFLRGCYFTQIKHRPLNRGAVGNPAVLDDAEILVPLAVLFAFVTSQEHADSLASGKQLCNRAGLHHAGFSSIFCDIETLCRKDFLKIAILPSNCESWGKML